MTTPLHFLGNKNNAHNPLPLRPADYKTDVDEGHSIFQDEMG
jgi:hypothetical protein